MPPEKLAEEIDATKALTKNSFGVNLILIHPHLNELIDVCISHKVSHVVLAGGLPSQQIISHLKDGGIKVMAFAPSLLLGKKLIKMGVDALIIEGHEAGGHIGPVVTSVLAQEILPYIKDVPVFVAGGIGCGDMMINYLLLGASGVQLGTRFVCTHECIAHPNFKQAFIRAQARDAMPSVQLDDRFPVIPVRAITNQATKAFQSTQLAIIEKYNRGEIELREGQLEIEHFWAGSLRRAVIDGDVETGSLMAGQSVGMITKEQSISEVFHDLIVEAKSYLKTIC
jgi:enoyl-[acyl-carrier protein] reductase II